MSEPKFQQIPPPCIASDRVLLHAVVDESVISSGGSLLFVDVRELGRVPRLAICQERKSSGVLLVHCDEEWNPLGCSAHDSVEAAKQRAQGIYPNIGERWVNAGVTEADAERYLDELYQGFRCSICGKRADQVGQLHQENGALICDSCR